MAKPETPGQAKLQQIKQELRARMHEPVQATGQWLKRVVWGYYQYHAVPGNLQQLGRFRWRLARLWRYVLRRRSQKSRVTWKEIGPVFEPVDSCTAHLASLPECAFRRSYPREEPDALAAPVRICAGAVSDGRPYRDARWCEWIA